MEESVRNIEKERKRWGRDCLWIRITLWFIFPLYFLFSNLLTENERERGRVRKEIEYLQWKIVCNEGTSHANWWRCLLALLTIKPLLKKSSSDQNLIFYFFFPTLCCGGLVLLPLRTLLGHPCTKLILITFHFIRNIFIRIIIKKICEFHFFRTNIKSCVEFISKELFEFTQKGRIWVRLYSNVELFSDQHL